MFPSAFELNGETASHPVQVSILHDGRPIFKDTYLVRDRADMNRAVFRAHAEARRLRSDLDPCSLRAAISGRDIAH